MIASLLGIRHLVLCVNKMDLVGYSQERFEEIRDDFIGFSERLQVYDLTCIPISALAGDNVVERSRARCPGTQGSRSSSTSRRWSSPSTAT